MGWGERRAILAAVMLAAAMPSAMAADCAPLRQLTSIPLTLDGSRILLPVRLNGAEKTFMLDTGGAYSQIAPSVVQELGLITLESSVKLMDLYGHASARAARLATLGLGNLQARNTTLQVAPLSFPAEEHFVGLLASDYMSHYDVELDLADGKLNYFSPDHCEGKVIYWKPPVIAVVPMALYRQHIQLSVTLNGTPMNAILDTGAPISVMSASEAKRLFAIDDKTPGNIEMGELDGKKSFVRVFDRLEFEGVAVSGLRVAILPDMVGSHDANNANITGSNLIREDDVPMDTPPLTIGMNVISKLRLYLAFHEGRMYVTPATSAAKAHYGTSRRVRYLPYFSVDGRVNLSPPNRADSPAKLEPISRAVGCQFLIPVVSCN